MNSNKYQESNGAAQPGRSAAVIGGSFAGLLAARVLSEHFEQVTVLEKDAVHDYPESRRGQPQTRHAHGLLAHGLELLEGFFPGLTAELVATGAVKDDMGQAIRWYQAGGYRRQFKSGLQGIIVSRPVLEWKIRARIEALPNVTIRGGVRVERLIPNSSFSRISGLVIRDPADGKSRQGLVADLVVDASGRGSRMPRWLAETGHKPPLSEEVQVDLTYVSRLYRRRPGDCLKGKMATFLPGHGADKRLAFLLPMEDDRWILTFGGWHGQPLPGEDRALVRFLRDLPAADIFQVLKDAEPLGDFVVHKFPASRRRRYEQLSRFPDGLLVLGDALASFTPVYAQGMTSAAMQASALGDMLDRREDLSGLWRPYFKSMAGLVDMIWQLGVTEDFRYAETRGQKPWAADLINWYTGHVHRATHNDTVVYGQFLRVMNLLAPATSLFKPNIVVRILYDSLRRLRNRIGRPVRLARVRQVLVRS